MKYLRTLFVIVLLLPAVASATSWQIIPEKSSITFSGTHAGTAFKGTFSKFEAQITFDKSALDLAKVMVNVDVSSAKTGDATYDGTLPEADWLDSKSTTTAIFKTKTITANKKGYLAHGVLTLRDKSIPVKLPFTLISQTDGTTLMQGKTTLNRMDFDIGKASDASGEWVSLEIPLSIRLVAKPK